MTAPSNFNSTPELDATLVFRVAYDGSSYSGFAEQPGQTTVAGELRRAIETLLRRPIDLTCAGRTDAGVHAVAQYISVPVTDAELALTRRRWLRAMDALLGKDIAINEVYKARKGFSARFDARSRTYTYRIADRDARPVLSRGAVWWHRYPLDSFPWMSMPWLPRAPRSWASRTLRAFARSPLPWANLRTAA